MLVHEANSNDIFMNLNNSGIRIYEKRMFVKKSTYFIELYVAIKTADGETSKLFGSYKEVKLISRREFKINRKETYIEILEIENLGGKPNLSLKKEFEISNGSCPMYDIVSYIKIPNIKYLPSNEVIAAILQYLTDKNNVIVKNQMRTEIFGVIDKKIILTPINYKELEVIDETNESEAFSLIGNVKYTTDELNEFMDILYRYLSKDPLNLISFCYFITGVFRLYLFNEYNLKEFSFFLLFSQKHSLGKTARLRLIASLFNGWDGMYSSDVLKGTETKLARTHNIMTVQYIDDPNFIYNVENFKSLATTKYVKINRGKTDGTFNEFYLLRPMAFSSNSFNVGDKQLASRFITIDVGKHKSIYEELEDDLNYLQDNYKIFSSYFWNNIRDIMNQVSINSTKRKDAKSEILNLGLRLINYVFNKFNKDELKVKFTDYIEESVNIVKTEEDNLRTLILELIESQTKVSFHGNYTSINKMWNAPLGDEFDEVVNLGIKSGIYYTKCKEILLHKNFLEVLKRKSSQFKNMNRISDLSHYFNDNEIEIINSNNKGRQTVTCFGVKHPKTGLLIKNNYEYELVEEDEE